MSKSEKWKIIVFPRPHSMRYQSVLGDGNLCAGKCVSKLTTSRTTIQNTRRTSIRPLFVSVISRPTRLPANDLYNLY
jgi:hypothetical protein